MWCSSCAAGVRAGASTHRQVRGLFNEARRSGSNMYVWGETIAPIVCAQTYKLQLLIWLQQWPRKGCNNDMPVYCQKHRVECRCHGPNHNGQGIQCSRSSLVLSNIILFGRNVSRSGATLVFTQILCCQINTFCKTQSVLQILLLSLNIQKLKSFQCQGALHHNWLPNQGN